VVTEYAWQATSCDPCPGPTLTEDELEVLGADVLEGPIVKPRLALTEDFVLTRMHTRYGKDIKNDLVFKQATPIVGGREEPGPSGQLEEGARASDINNFQARYAIRYPWTGPIRCVNPVRGVWGGPPSEVTTADPVVKPALDLAFAKRDAVQLASVVARDVPEIGLRAGVVETPQTTNHTVSSGSPKRTSGCGCQTTDGGDVLWGGLLVGTSILARRRRRR
jgi:MYXO-CTERM domain-containing protein